MKGICTNKKTEKSASSKSNQGVNYQIAIWEKGYMQHTKGVGWDRPMDKYMEDSRLLYGMLGDELSQKIYVSRVLFSVTGDNAFLQTAIDAMPVAQAFIQQMDDFEPTRTKLIYGAGQRGQMLAKQWKKYNWAGFIDRNPALHGKELQGLPVLSIEAATEKYRNPVIVIANKQDSSKIRDTLRSYGMDTASIVNIGDSWNLLNAQQYFDLEQLPHVSEEVFIDLGAYDGFTSERFTQWCAGEFFHIWAFEPDAANVEICRQKLKNSFGKGKFDVIEKAAWNTVREIAMSGTGDIASVTAQDDSHMVDATTLDWELADKKVTYIKMDIEGAELEALQGGQKVIAQNLPKLAISVYHKPEDIFSIPSWLMSRYPGCYSFFLRHYSLGEWDTVLYAIPI